jgi:hypothetical protein
MAVFENKEKMQAVLGGLFEKMLADPVFGPKFAEAGITIRFNISEPNAVLWITPGDGKHGKVFWDLTGEKATVEMTLSGDTCHKFWLKQIAMPIALAKGLIKAKGPMPKILKLLPMLGPAYEIYPEWARANGLTVD